VRRMEQSRWVLPGTEASVPAADLHIMPVSNHLSDVAGAEGNMDIY
jgi:hypothetical protein